METQLKKSEIARLNRLMPLVDGLRTPKYIRCYDNGGVDGNRVYNGEKAGTLDRYTVVYTGRYTHMTGGAFWHVCMNGAPFHPQGIGMHGESMHKPCDRPSYGHLGKRIAFKDLPEDCQKLVVSDYMNLWDIQIVTKPENLIEIDKLN